MDIWIYFYVFTHTIYISQATDFNSTETVAVVAGHKAVLEVSLRDVSLPAVIRLFYDNGSQELELGSSAIMNWLGNAGSCAFWRKLDVNDTWFLLQRVYCKRGPYQGIPRAAFTIVLTTYPINSSYSGNFTFKIGAWSNLLHHTLTEESGREHYITKQILIVTRDWFDPTFSIAIQNLNPNYPFIFDAVPNHIWVRQGALAKMTLHLSNFEFPLFLLQRISSEEAFSQFYNISFENGDCIGHFLYSSLFRSGRISACIATATEGQYRLQVNLETNIITSTTLLQGIIIASYNNTIDETNFRMKGIASASFNMTSYTRECRAESKGETQDIFVEKLGSSVLIDCSVSCGSQSSNLAVGIKQKSPNISDPIYSYCENGIAKHSSGSRGKVAMDCRTTRGSVTARTVIVVTFEIRNFTAKNEGEYECFVEDYGFKSSYRVPVYRQKLPKLTLTGTASKVFASEGQYTTLTCYAVDGQPSAKIVWLLDNNVTNLSSSYLSLPEDRGNSTSVLRLPMSHLYNGRRVRCATVASGSLKSIRSSAIQINFYHPPLEVEDQMIDSDSSVNITCNLFKSNPPVYPKNCSVSIDYGRETILHDAIPDDPIVIEPGQSARVHCFCNFSFLGQTATPQSSIYVNWRGFVNLEAEAAIMRYFGVYVSVTIGGVAIVLIVTYVIMQLRGHSLRRRPLPNIILSKPDAGPAYLEKTVSNARYTQIVIKHLPNASATTSADGKGVRTSAAGLLAGQSTDIRSLAIQKNKAFSPSKPETALLGTNVTTTKDGRTTELINKKTTHASSKRLSRTDSMGQVEIVQDPKIVGRLPTENGAQIIKQPLQATHVILSTPVKQTDNQKNMTAMSTIPAVPRKSLEFVDVVDGGAESSSSYQNSSS